MSGQQVLWAVLVSCVAATASHAADPVKVVEVDKRKDKTAADKYAVVLCARPHNLKPKKDGDKAPADDQGKTVGHAWVVWGVEDSKKQMSRTDAAFGFYPVKGTSPVTIAFAKVPGEVVDQLNKPRDDDDFMRVTHRLIVLVDKGDYDNSLKVVEKWQKEKPKYDLYTSSCKTFTNDVAKALGLTAEDPDKYDWPEDMLVKLIEKAVKKDK